VAPLTRCLNCNCPIGRITKEEAGEAAPPLSRQHASEFRRCSGCGKVYWNGSHYRRMEAFVENVLGKLGDREGQ
jgi:uncharacterized protein with PIN domain